MKLPLGQKVTFQGKRAADGSMLYAQRGGPDIFEATIVSYPYDICYALEFPDGRPVGLPFHDESLTPVE